MKCATEAEGLSLEKGSHLFVAVRENEREEKEKREFDLNKHCWIAIFKYLPTTSPYPVLKSNLKNLKSTN